MVIDIGQIRIKVETVFSRQTKRAKGREMSVMEGGEMLFLKGGMR